ncbi:MAG: hypothetical protein A2Y24_02965 [Clostridiales bacterium GWE2_32_10]|nr:MAG: hypothetical protein A2Y24_02965 [Clostridiales bacterium GWE2_32_10]HBY19542.1 hypothetical protein [Clostridiales bacterium]
MSPLKKTILLLLAFYALSLIMSFVISKNQEEVYRKSGMAEKETYIDEEIGIDGYNILLYIEDKEFEKISEIVDRNKVDFDKLKSAIDYKYKAMYILKDYGSDGKIDYMKVEVMKAEEFFAKKKGAYKEILTLKFDNKTKKIIDYEITKSQN